jgi:serine/threonine protein kinase
MNIIDALAFLQSNNYTHSNLKLSNILLSKECAKLSDFSKCQRINDE